MNYTQLFKKLINGEPIVKSDYESLKRLTEKDVQELQATYKRLKEAEGTTKKSKEEDDLEPFSKYYELRGHGFNIEIYKKLLPLTLLACRLENNTGAQLHASKLASLFASTEDALAYLEKFEKENRDRPQMIHDACLFSLPEGNEWNIHLWQELAKRHMPNKILERVLPFAHKIEDYVAKHRKELEAKITQDIRCEYELNLSQKYDREEQEKLKKQEISLEDLIETQLKKDQRKIDRDIETAFRGYLIELHQLPMEGGNLTKAAKENLKQIYKKLSGDEQKRKQEITKRIKDYYAKIYREKLEAERKTTSANKAKNEVIQEWLARDAKKIDAECKTACYYILSPHTTPATLLNYAKNTCYRRATENPEAAMIFFENGLGEKQFNDYLALTIPTDDHRQIPNVLIEGASIGYPGFYIKKLDRRDPRGAALGRLTSCCQSLGNTGEACAINGITDLNAGFYVLCRQEGAIPSPSDPIYAQSWVWRGNHDSIVFDSIESQINFRQHGNNRTMICDMYTYLAQDLVMNRGVPKVYVGEGSGTSDDLGFDLKSTTEFPINYNGYRDSTTQKIVADQNIPLFKISTRLNLMSKNIFERSKTKNEFSCTKIELESIGVDFSSTLFVAIKNKNLAWVQHYVAQDGDLNVYKRGRTALGCAIEHNDIEMIKYLVENGANVNGINVVHNVFTKGNLELIKYFGEHGAHINGMTDDKGNTALNLAMNSNDREMIKWLVERSVNKDDIVFDFMNALIKTDNLEIIKSFIECIEQNKAIFEKVIHMINTARPEETNYAPFMLHLARTSNFEMLKYLADKGANLEVQDSWNEPSRILFDYLEREGAPKNLIDYLKSMKENRAKQKADDEEKKKQILHQFKATTETTVVKAKEEKEKQDKRNTRGPGSAVGV